MGITLDTVATKRAGNRKGRPNYPQTFKRQLAIAACEPGASVSRLALDHGLNANMVAKWKREYLADLPSRCDQAILLPVSVPDEVTVVGSETVVAQVENTSAANTVESSGNIEIEIGGALVRLNGSVEASQLRLVLRCVKSS